MAIPANLNSEAAPYGATPVVPCVGPQGGPYVVGGPQAAPLLLSAPRTAEINSAVQTNYGYRGVYIYTVVGVNPGGARTLTITVWGYDPATGLQYPLLVLPATATPQGAVLIYPGLSGAAVEGVAATRNLVLPAAWFINVLPSDATAWNYSITGILLP